MASCENSALSVNTECLQLSDHVQVKPTSGKHRWAQLVALKRRVRRCYFAAAAAAAAAAFIGQTNGLAWVLKILHGSHPGISQIKSLARGDLSWMLIKRPWIEVAKIAKRIRNVH